MNAGFAFLPGAAIDQHFSQRRRQPDREIIRSFPQWLGIGIDESTALVVQEANARVIGGNSVFFYDRSAGADSDPLRVVQLSTGEACDLERRMRIE